jgi:hypothetical protein
MGRDDKFDEHALPGFYVGPSPENPEEKYVWTGTRHIGGSFVIDESRFLQPIHLGTEYFDSWPVPTPDSTLPLVQPPPPPTRTAQVLKEPLPNGTVLEFDTHHYSHMNTGLHVVHPVVGSKSRVVLGSFVGYSSSELKVWS